MVFRVVHRGIIVQSGMGCQKYSLSYNKIYSFYYQLAGAGTSYKKNDFGIRMTLFFGISIPVQVRGELEYKMSQDGIIIYSIPFIINLQGPVRRTRKK